ncbi:winged helix-turn-helix domain-containing protein [Mycoplasmopsis glycophila]|uniref:GntR family transcriptional regulator n=1 Tax=Mycoplasmopsis glycophila TaxID=171285 RepID=A0A449AWJ4_9BACT|nr:winged helix-turn-helix domain-containing protein [Mycoplasmopsis glycophila]VEU71086.1 GntR family transcriptional regulator [Mycoplasmopsis glycophila]
MTNKQKNKTTQIIEYLMDLIRTRRIPVNKIMPSEHQLMHKFDCSRNIVVAAYQKLEFLGAVYSIQKRGHFVAENFHNLIKPISFLFAADKQTGVEVQGDVPLPQWAEDKNIIFVNGFRVFDKKFYKENELIAEARIFMSLKNIDQFEPIDCTKPLIDVLLEKEDLTNIVYELEFDNVEKFGQNPSLGIRFFGYDADSISIAGVFYVDPKHFKFFHQEFSL